MIEATLIKTVICDSGTKGYVYKLSEPMCYDGARVRTTRYAFVITIVAETTVFTCVLPIPLYADNQEELLTDESYSGKWFVAPINISPNEAMRRIGVKVVSGPTTGTGIDDASLDDIDDDDGYGELVEIRELTEKRWYLVKPESQFLGNELRSYEVNGYRVYAVPGGGYLLVLSTRVGNLLDKTELYFMDDPDSPPWGRWPDYEIPVAGKWDEILRNAGYRVAKVEVPA